MFLTNEGNPVIDNPLTNCYYFFCFRNFFHNKKQTDAEVLARMVEYVRKNVQHLETYSRDHLLFQSGKFTWLPFNEIHEDQEEEKEQRC